MDQRVCLLLAFIRDNPDHRRTVTQLAASINVSPSRFRHLFKESMGLTPAQYLKVEKMRRARELLETTFLSVKEVMSKLGFHDGSHFVRDFKKTYYLTPTQCRARHLKARRFQALRAIASSANK